MWWELLSFCLIMQFVKKSVFITYVIVVIGTFFETSIAQYEIAIQALEIMIPNENTFCNLDKVKLKRFGRNQPHVIHGEFKLIRGISDEIGWKSVLYKKQGQEYRLTPFQIKGKTCESIKIENPFAEKIWKYVDLPPRHTCPFPPGSYHINNFNFENLTDLPAVFDSGDYMVYSQFLDGQDDKKMLQGYKIFTTIYNKLLRTPVEKWLLDLIESEVPKCMKRKTT